LCAGFAGAFIGTTSASALAAPREPIDVDSCVSMTDHESSETTIEARLTSTCSRSLRCEISWTLACNNGQAPSEHTKRFTLKADGEAGARISTAVCKNDLWELDSLSWSCREP
jgi:hypothetical protein